MTNKEAIRILSNMIHDDKVIYGDKPKPSIDALDLAIKALEDIEEWNKLRLICANDGIIVYKVKEDHNADSN